MKHPKCPHCGSLLLAASDRDRVDLDLAPDVRWLCQNDYCELNRTARVQNDVVGTVGVVLRWTIQATKLALVCGAVYGLYLLVMMLVRG